MKKAKSVSKVPKVPKDWFDDEQLFGTIKKDCVCIGNQIIARLSCNNTVGQYFIVEDPSGWAYLVWDLNTPGGPFHGKFKNERRSVSVRTPQHVRSAGKLRQSVIAGLS